MIDSNSGLGVYTIQIAGEWNFEHLALFPRLYEQLYAFEYAFVPGKSDAAQGGNDDIASVFERYPWRGGWSAVGFYQSLIAAIPSFARPQVVSIEYGSPGTIRVRLFMKAALSVTAMAAAISATGWSGIQTYNAIYRGAQDRDLLRLQVQSQQLALTEAQIKFIDASIDELAQVIGFDELDNLRNYAPSDLVALKILMAEYRRGRDLNELKESGLLFLPPGP